MMVMCGSRLAKKMANNFITTQYIGLLSSKALLFDRLARTVLKLGLI